MPQCGEASAMVDAVRSMPEIVRDITAIRERHSSSLAAAIDGSASRAELDALARADAEIVAFGDLCRRTRTHHLMSTGLRWGDQLRHPARPGHVALVRLADTVEIDGATMTIVEATRMVATESGKGAAVADWSCGDIRLGRAHALEHPAPGTMADDVPAQASLL